MLLLQSARLREMKHYNILLTDYVLLVLVVVVRVEKPRSAFLSISERDNTARVEIASQVG